MPAPAQESPSRKRIYINPFTGEPELEVSNQEFLEGLFGDKWREALIAGFPDINVANPNWRASPAGNGRFSSLLPTDNTYFCISLFEDGVRQLPRFQAQYVVPLDDVGTKINADVAARLLPRPTGVLETSPGNCQWFYKLDEPCTDPRVYDAIFQALKSNTELNPSGRDPGQSKVNRYMRLPVGANNKTAYQAITGQPCFLHRLIEFEPSRTYSMETMARAFGADISEEALQNTETGRKGIGGHQPTQEEIAADPILALFEARDMVLDARKSSLGFIRVVCPWVDEHTNRDETGTGYKPGLGGFQCHHGHCEHRTVEDLKVWAAEEQTPEEMAAAASAAGFEMVPFEDRAFQPDPREVLPDIFGGVYPARLAMAEINKRFSIVNRAGDVLICHRNSKGEDVFMAVGAFHMLLSNVYAEVEKGDETKVIPASKWWLHNPERPLAKNPVFEPHRKVKANEYNLWRGFGVEPVEGVDLMQSFDAHLREVVCQGDMAKYDYLIGWLAWVVQHPELPAESVPVLVSECEGTGKSTVNTVMLRLFGQHGRVVADPDDLLGPHAGQSLELACFVALEEALFAGSNREADRMRNRVTGTKLPVNPKGMKAYEVPNRMSAILTTNHAHSIHAGTTARRWVVLRVSDAKAGDLGWFKKIYDDLEAGGYGQLLNYLQTKDISGWHPRKVIRTQELAEQQLRSAGAVETWLLACAEYGCIPGYEHGRRADIMSLDLDETHPTSKLHDYFVTYARAVGMGRVDASTIAFSRSLARILGDEARTRLFVEDNETRTRTRARVRAYRLGDSDTLHQAVEKSLGIK